MGGHKQWFKALQGVQQSLDDPLMPVLLVADTSGDAREHLQNIGSIVALRALFASVSNEADTRCHSLARGKLHHVPVLAHTLEGNEDALSRHATAKTECAGARLASFGVPALGGSLPHLLAGLLVRLLAVELLEMKLDIPAHRHVLAHEGVGKRILRVEKCFPRCILPILLLLFRALQSGV